MSERIRGTVKEWDDYTGALIVPLDGGASVWVQSSVVALAGLKQLAPGQVVEFESVQVRMVLEAASLRVIEPQEQEGQAR